MIRNITNLTASVRTRLLKIAKIKQRDFNAVLLQYFQERLLYRLSISPYRDKFVLKGALLFLVYDIPAARPTKDIDFLSREMDNKEQNLLNLIREIIKIQVRDGVRFDPQSLGVETIQGNAAYKGIRIHCTAHLGKARRRFHIDIGFGDKVVPAPFELDFPVFLNEMPTPKLIAYSPDSTIAEKFEAIVNLGFLNSRMKDFFDIYHLANNRDFDSEILKKALETTFKHRKTNLLNRFQIYSHGFINDTTNNRQWEAFKTKVSIKLSFTFADTVNFIKNFIEPVFENDAKKNWKHRKLKWKK